MRDRASRSSAWRKGRYLARGLSPYKAGTCGRPARISRGSPAGLVAFFFAVGILFPQELSYEGYKLNPVDGVRARSGFRRWKKRRWAARILDQLRQQVQVRKNVEDAMIFSAPGISKYLKAAGRASHYSWSMDSRGPLRARNGRAWPPSWSRDRRGSATSALRETWEAWESRSHTD